MSENETEAPSGPQESLGSKWAKEFAGLAGVMLEEKLRPVMEHIQREEVASKKLESQHEQLLMVLRALDSELKFIRIELKATRNEQAALASKVEAMAERQVLQEERLRALERKVG